MNTKTTSVDWYAYAQKYDMLLAYNPFYQEVHRQVVDRVKDWPINKGDIIVDLGAGTGNYSVAVAGLFPQASILHIEKDEGMNAIAAKKAATLSNFRILDRPVEQTDFPENSLHGLLCINALYTFPDPEKMLKKMNRWLVPGARAILVDPGRIMNLFAWKIAISWHLLKTYGLGKTLKVFREARAVSQQNAYIQKMQRNGTFWTHTHEEFCEAVRQAGFEIEGSGTCFRGDCDLVIAGKL